MKKSLFAVFVMCGMFLAGCSGEETVTAPEGDPQAKPEVTVDKASGNQLSGPAAPTSE